MMTAGSISKFKQLSQFKTLKEFNSSVEQYLLDSPFTKSETVAFKRLVRYSAKFPGICFAKIQTLVAATHKETLGISRSTFERMLNKAKKAGILTVKNTMKNNRKGHNVYVFTPYKQAQVVSKTPTIDVLEVEKTEALNKANSLSKTDKPNTYKERKEEPSPVMDSDFVSSNISKEFIDAVKTFYNEADTIVSLYSRLKVAVRKSGDNSLITSHMSNFVKTFKESIYKYKQGKVHSSLFGYIYSSWEKSAAVIARSIHNPRDIYYNWIEEDSPIEYKATDKHNIFAELMGL